MSNWIGQLAPTPEAGGQKQPAGNWGGASLRPASRAESAVPLLAGRCLPLWALCAQPGWSWEGSTGDARPLQPIIGGEGRPRRKRILRRVAKSQPTPFRLPPPLSGRERERLGLHRWVGRGERGGGGRRRGPGGRQAGVGRRGPRPGGGGARAPRGAPPRSGRWRRRRRSPRSRMAASALYACTKCTQRYPFEELSQGQQLCKVRGRRAAGGLGVLGRDPALSTGAVGVWSSGSSPGGPPWSEGLSISWGRPLR